MNSKKSVAVRSTPDRVCDQRWTDCLCAGFPEPERSGGGGKSALAPVAMHLGAMKTTNNSAPVMLLLLCAMR